MSVYDGPHRRSERRDLLAHRTSAAAKKGADTFLVDAERHLFGTRQR